MSNEVDILENDLIAMYPDVLDVLLRDHTTQKNIFWATNNYQHLGVGYEYNAEIKPELISGENGHIIMPRVKKEKSLQQERAKDMAEVFTPSWICNAQNNLIDNAWFGRENVFNTEIVNPDGSRSWQTNSDKIVFPKPKTWKNYVRDIRLEMTCGEAPYITSRYDTTTGDFIPIENRIGLLDRKLRIVTENTDTSEEWLYGARKAYKSMYAFEWQGDSLLLAREAMLYTFIENYINKFNKKPLAKSVNFIAYIISWNAWQMDGLKGVVPNTCGDKIKENSGNLFPDDRLYPCEGCTNDNLFNHNGMYCLIKDWRARNPESNKKGKKIKFVELLKKS